jgi:tripartite motif-containing protein 2/3/tripartite motif-containing protein 71
MTSLASPEKYFLRAKIQEVAKLGERATAVLYVVNNERKAHTEPVRSLTCELVSESTGEKIDCSVKKIEASGQYEISYQATSRGRHQLHIKVEGKHIKGSPFPVTVIKKTITGMNRPWGVAINSKGNIIVAEYGEKCISIFSPEGEKIRSFGSEGSRPGQFKWPQGVAVDDDDNILVVDNWNNRIQKFTSDGRFVSAVDNLDLKSPVGIAIHPHSKNIYVTDSYNGCILILDPDLTLSSSFGSEGSGNGQFLSPCGVAFDSTGNVYVADSGNHRIQVFTAEGEYLRKFDHGNLYDISIDSEDVLYVAENDSDRVLLFTRKGRLMTLFGSWGTGLGQFHSPCGIALDKDSNIYVSDTWNNRLQIF